MIETELARCVASWFPGAIGVAHATKLSGGASQETWSFDIVHVEGTTGAILRRAPKGYGAAPTRAAGLEAEARLMQLAHDAGLPSPRVIHVLKVEDDLGTGFIMQRIAGETIARKILRDAQFALGFLGLAAHDRVPDHAVQHGPGDLALDQVVLRSGPHRLLAEVLARLPGEHDDGRLGLDAQQLPQPLQALRVGQAQIEQHAGHLRHEGRGLAEGAGPLHHDRSVYLRQELLREQGVAVVVFDEQDRHLVVAARGGGGIKLRVTCHRYLHHSRCLMGVGYPIFADIPSCPPFADPGDVRP